MENKINDIPYLGCSEESIKNSSPVISVDVLKHYYDYVTERYKIYKQREKGLPAPWTENEFLLKYKFTNIRREHDRVTKWLLDNITNSPDISYLDKIYQTMIFRMYNRIDTSECIGLGKDFTWDMDVIKKAIDNDPNPGRDFYTRAFRTLGLKNAMKKKLYPDEPNKYLAAMYIIDLRKEDKFSRLMNPENAEEACNIIQELHGVGKFLSYQIFVDLTYIKEFPISENEYVLSGPGCSRGMDHLFLDKDGLTDEEILFWLRDNFEEVMRLVNKDYSSNVLLDNLEEHNRSFNVMSLENCFCEFSKYMWSILKLGSPRRKFNSDDAISFSK